MYVNMINRQLYSQVTCYFVQQYRDNAASGNKIDESHVGYFVGGEFFNGHQKHNLWAPGKKTTQQMLKFQLVLYHEQFY